MKTPFKTLTTWLGVLVLAAVGTSALAQFTRQSLMDGTFVIRNEATQVDILHFEADNDVWLLDGQANAGGKLMKLNRWCGTGALLDVSAIGGSWYLASPVTGTIAYVETVLGGAISSADAEVSVAVGGALLSTFTIANSGAAAGTIDLAAYGSGDGGTVNRSTLITIGSDGKSSTSARLEITICIDVE
jgi:hypothetical protein